MAILKKNCSLLQHSKLWLGILLIFLLSFAFRNHIAERDLQKLERSTGCSFAPFLVESAIMYSYMNDFADGKNIAQSDPRLPAMKDQSAAEQMSLSLEYFGGYLIKLRRAIYGSESEGIYERSYAETRFIRKGLTCYLALVPVFIFLALYWMRVPWCFALLSAAAQIFSAAALGRYTGQDLIKGAFALPFLSAYLACYAAVLFQSRKARRFALVGAMLTAAAAAASWDASGMIIGILALSEVILSISAGSANRKKRDFYLATFIAMTLTMLFIPYCLKHGTIFSPVMQFAIPAAAAVNMMPNKHRRIWQIVFAALLAVWSFLAVKFSPFAGNYNHFSELLAAKLKFGNVLPADPTLLTFDQRYLWTPELHSATYRISKLIYPAALPMALLLLMIFVAVTIIKRFAGHRLALTRKVRFNTVMQFALLTIIWLVLYIYFMRFRDMTMFFGVLLLGTLCSAFLKRINFRIAGFYILLLIMLAVVVVEWKTSRQLKRAYPEGMKYTADLIQFLREHDLSGKIVLTDMQNSAMLKAYTDASILIQAKYELPAVRQLTREYLTSFFNVPLEEFAEFCDQNDVDYLLIHLPIITTPAQEPYSYRYMVCADTLKADSAAVRLGMKKGIEKNFYEITLPDSVRNINGYRLYKFIPTRQIEKAEKLSNTALKNYSKNPRSSLARRQIRRAYRMAPGPGKIYENYAVIRRAIPPEIKLKKRSAAQR